MLFSAIPQDAWRFFPFANFDTANHPPIICKTPSGKYRDSIKFTMTVAVDNRRRPTFLQLLPLLRRKLPLKGTGGSHQVTRKINKSNQNYLVILDYIHLVYSIIHQHYSEMNSSLSSQPVISNSPSSQQQRVEYSQVWGPNNTYYTSHWPAAGFSRIQGGLK